MEKKLNEPKQSYLESSLVFYVCIPLLIYTILIWSCYANIEDITNNAEVLKLIGHFNIIKYDIFPNFIAQNFNINIGFLVLLTMCAMYLYLELFAGTVANFTLISCYFGANAFYTYFGPDNAWKYALILHISSWFFQVALGHAHFEERRPALLDSLLQSFFIAPLFVHFELLFWLGFYKDLKVRIGSKIGVDVLNYRKSFISKTK